MIFHSSNKKDSLQIKRRDSDDSGAYPTGLFAVTGTVGDFVVSNKSVIFEFPQAFVDALKQFEATRKGSILLNGTEGCHIKVEPDGGSGAIWMSFRVAKVLYTGPTRTGRAKSSEISLTGGFSVDGESVGSMARNLEELFKGR